MKRLPAAAWLCGGVALANALAWSLITPPFQVPDENAHYAYVRTGEGYDVYSYGPDKAQGGGDDIVIHGGEGAAPPTAGK